MKNNLCYLTDCAVKPKTNIKSKDKKNKCTLSNAEIIKTGEKIFCAKFFGFRDRKTGFDICKKYNAKFPLPRNPKETAVFGPVFTKMSSSKKHTFSTFFIDAMYSSKTGIIYLSNSGLVCNFSAEFIERDRFSHFFKGPRDNLNLISIVYFAI